MDLSSEVKDHPVSLGETCGQHIKSSSLFGFLEQNYFVRSVATQILHDSPQYTSYYTIKWEIHGDLAISEDDLIFEELSRVRYRDEVNVCVDVFVTVFLKF